MRARASSLLVVLLMAAGLRGDSAPAGPSVITDDFVQYMKRVTNPHEFGLRADRFYPYSTPFGRRIGYRQAVTDKAWHRAGWAKQDAEQRLRDDLRVTEVQLRTCLAKEHPRHPYDKLSTKAREVLLDRAYTDGAANLPDDFRRAVLEEDWTTLVEQGLYLRSRESWPDILANNAFAARWVYAKGAAARKTEDAD